MGHIALAGGNEFRDNCRVMDEGLLALIGSRPAGVVILPTAAIRGNPRLAAENGVRHFQRLGAHATAAMVITRADADTPHWADQVRQADLVYLAGGDPPYLLDTLQNSLVYQAILTVHQRGGMIVGSSAGAMVLAEKTGPPASPDWRPGLNLVSGVAVVPHHHPSRSSQIKGWRQALDNHITLLGIPEATACVTEDGHTWRVMGIADVSLYSRDNGQTFAPDQTFVIRSLN